MSSEVLFEEVQEVKGLKIKRFFKVATGIILLTALVFFIIQKSHITQTVILLSVLGLICIGISLFPAFALTNQLRTDGVYLRYPPMQIWFTIYPWTEIAEAYIRKCDVMREYGLGIRMSPSGIGYTWAGDTGLQLIFKNGTRLFVTTNKSEELEIILKRLGY